MKLKDSRISKCPTCEALFKRGGWDTVDLIIYHNNGHVWPGFAGEPF